jgi:Sigma-70 region 2
MSDLAAEFERLRPHLTRVAYGTLGSLAEAEDVVQDAWLRPRRAARSRFPASAEEQERVVVAFAVACQDGDLDGLMRLLDPEVVMRSDGGGRISAARKPLEGADRVSRACWRSNASGESMAARPAVRSGSSTAPPDSSSTTAKLST